MKSVIPLPLWVSLIIIFGIYVLTLYVKSRSWKGGLTRYALYVSIPEAIVTGNALILVVTFLYFLSIGELERLFILLEEPTLIAVMFLFLLASVIDYGRRNWKALRKKDDR